MLAGETLKRLRKNRALTVRAVEQASQLIAAAKSDPRFHISIGWLAKIEQGSSEPAICKLFSLSVIYEISFLEIVQIYKLDIDKTEEYRVLGKSHAPQLVKFEPAISSKIDDFNRQETTLLNADFTKNKLSSVSLTQSSSAKGLAHGYVGLYDYTMYPLIRPGSLVRIDTFQRKLTTTKWRNEYERPIYFVELRTAYACGWCEVSGKDLLLIPHHLSPASIRRFVLVKEAEIVGRVIGYDTACVDMQEIVQARVSVSG
jgi:transcriptional regulator with XRE-family HTH domain